ncbi:MAG: PIN domain-containing protein [Candidatus Competibacter sp.]|nr:PIN domain-containing protein [Candidatus Competibacter sp.]
MPPTVRAQVVDIRGDAPTASDRFLVDSNAWYWLFYARASQTPSAPQPYQLRYYPNYLKQAIQTKSILYCCALNYAELAHNIEKAEREIYADKASKNIGAKPFRHDYPNQRLKIVRLIGDTWSDVRSISTLLDLTLDSAFMQSAMTLFPSVGLDGYDLFMAETALHSGISQIITDDGDFATVPGITLFTANQRVIQDAKADRKLLIR